MSNGELVEVVESGLAINDGRSLLDIANRAEELVMAVRKIKSIVFQITNSNDWIDEQGKPYLQVSGAEKIRPLFGIEWDIDPEPEITEEEDGHKTFKYHGTFSMGSKTVSIIGSRSSKDPFFSRANRADRPIAEINMANVDKAAYTNTIGNGITRILGIRNMTWKELEDAGLGKAQSASVTRNAAPCAPKFGEFAGRPLTDIPDHGLVSYVEYLEQAVKDPKKADFKKANIKMGKAFEAEIARREAQQATETTLPATPDDTSAIKPPAKIKATKSTPTWEYRDAPPPDAEEDTQQMSLMGD